MLSLAPIQATLKFYEQSRKVEMAPKEDLNLPEGEQPEPKDTSAEVGQFTTIKEKPFLSNFSHKQGLFSLFIKRLYDLSQLWNFIVCFVF